MRRTTAALIGSFLLMILIVTEIKATDIEGQQESQKTIQKVTKTPFYLPGKFLHDENDVRVEPRFIEPQLICYSPSWSPDSKYVMFVAYGGIQPSLTIPKNIWVTDGSKRWLVSKFFFGKIPPPAGFVPEPMKLDAGMVSWSPDGTKIALMAFEGEDRPIGLPMNLYVMKSDGSDIFLVSTTGITCNDALLQWTENGKNLLLNSLKIDMDGNKSQTNENPRAKALKEAFISNDVNTLGAIIGTNPSRSPDGKRIVFEGGKWDPGNLYVVDCTGKNLKRITNLTSPGLILISGSYPRWSPNGKQIVFRRGHYIWVANVDGSEETCVIKGTDYSQGYELYPSWPCKWAPCWNTDGSIIFARYFKRTYPVEIEVCATNGNKGDVRRIFVWKSPTVALKSENDNDNVCWSPDGSNIAFENNQNIWIVKGNGTEQKRLTGGLNPRWSPDSRKILYVRGSLGTEVLYTINIDGNNQIQVTNTADGYSGYHGWSPDGKTIAFESHGQIMTGTIEGDKFKRLISGSQPCWSPDGKRIAFAAGGLLISKNGSGQGPACVYIINADGSGIRPVMQVGSSGYRGNSISNLSWSPDGKHISFEENSSQIWIIAISEPVFYQSSSDDYQFKLWKAPKFN